jgi:methyl-accepting chemotaxis protein
MSAVLLSVLGIFMARNNNASIQMMMDSKGDAVAHFVEKVSAEYFAIFDFNDFENFVKALESDPEVEFAVFYNDKMEPLTKTDKLPKDSSSLIIYDRQIIGGGGDVLGYMKLGYNKHKLTKSLNKNIKIIATSIIISLTLLSIGLIILVRKVMIGRVQETVDMLKDIAENDGDLTKRLRSDSGDELGDLSKWFNKFINNIHEIIATVQINADSVASASSELSATADHLSKGSIDQKTQTEQVASAMSEMSQSIVDVVKNADLSAQASENVSDIATRGRNVVDETVKGMGKIAEAVRDTALIVETLGKSSAEIGEILNVINDIADQTNLLALNAAIEAARAGEHGRGFAVVADEVRKLAENTGNATKEISEMIKNIQNETDRSVISMKAGREEAESGVRLAEEAKKALDEIVESSRKAAETVRLITVAAQEQSTSTEHVSQNMESILTVTHESSAATDQIKQSSGDLGKLSSELQKRIGFFRV